MDAVSMLINFLRAKNEITSLEKDILDTWSELNKQPFTMETAKKQVFLNDEHHKDIFEKIASMPTTVSKPIYTITEDDVRYNLTNQFTLLVEKEMEEQNGGK